MHRDHTACHNGRVCIGAILRVRCTDGRIKKLEHVKDKYSRIYVPNKVLMQYCMLIKDET